MFLFWMLLGIPGIAAIIALLAGWSAFSVGTVFVLVLAFTVNFVPGNFERTDKTLKAIRKANQYNTDLATGAKIAELEEQTKQLKGDKN